MAVERIHERAGAPADAKHMPAGEVAADGTLDLFVIGSVVKRRGHAGARVCLATVFGEVDLWWPDIPHRPEQGNHGDALARVHPQTNLIFSVPLS
jgi:hypothetical protein